MPAPERKTYTQTPKQSPYCANRDMITPLGTITNLEEMKHFVLTSLGSPVICVELSDEQLTNVIIQAVKFCHKYYNGTGSYLDYIKLTLFPGCTHYRICQDLQDVIDLEVSSWLGDINQMFTIPHSMLYHQTMNFTFTGQCYGNNTGYGDILGNWEASLVYLKEFKNNFGEFYQSRYNNLTKELSVWPTPKKHTDVLMKVYKKEKAINLFNDIDFQRLVIAWAGMRWTMNLRKFNMQLAGGGTLNADSMYGSFKEDYDKVVEQISGEFPGVAFVEMSH